MNIHGGLLEAYLGYYEEEWQNEFADSPAGAGDFSVTFKEWLNRRATTQITEDSPKQRLDIYLEWNGILGYTETIWDISQGQFTV
jgi:hypothetical protein